MKKPSLFQSLQTSADQIHSARRNGILFWTSVVLATILLYLALLKMDWRAFLSLLQGTKYYLLPILVLWNTSTLWVRAVRWRVLLIYAGEFPLSNVFLANSAGYLGNNLLPARAGEIIRAVYLGQQNNTTSSFVLATGLVERLLDLIALIALGTLSLSSVGILSQPLQTGLWTVSVLASFGLASVFVLPALSRQISALLDKLPILNTNAKAKLIHFQIQFFKGLQSLHDWKSAGLFLVFTLLIWFMDAFSVTFLASALNLTMDIRQALVLLAALGISSAIPSTPGYVGVYQFVAVMALGPFGFSNADAVVLILFAQIINLVVIIIWGTAALMRFSKIATEHQRVQ